MRLQIGPIKNASDSLPGVTRDTASGKYTPATAGEWNTVLAAAGIASGGPSLLWLCQEASGNLADSIGAFTGTAAGIPITYQQAATGWTRLGVVGSDGGAGNVDNTAAGLPDPAAASMMMLSYWSIPAGAPAAIRNYQVMGTANITTTRINTTPRFQGLSGASSTTGTATIAGDRMMITQYDITNNVVRCATDQELLLPVRAATTGRRHRLSLSSAGILLYHAAFMNAAAEISAAQMRTLGLTLGWSVLW